MAVTVGGDIASLKVTKERYNSGKTLLKLLEKEKSN